MAKKRLNDNVHNQAAQDRKLYTTVVTYDVEGNETGLRVVDMYHFGTRKWLQDHIWWAMHNGCTVEQSQSTQDEIDIYVQKGKSELVQRFNGSLTPAAHH